MALFSHSERRALRLRSEYILLKFSIVAFLSLLLMDRKLDLNMSMLFFDMGGCLPAELPLFMAAEIMPGLLISTGKLNRLCIPCRDIIDYLSCCFWLVA